MALNEAGSFMWTITDPSLLRQIETAKNGKQFVSKTFELASLNWRIEMNPNGCNKERIGSFDVFVKLMSISSKWKNITIRRTIESAETKSSFTAIDTYRRKGESSGWPVNTLTLNEVKEWNLSAITIIITVQVIQIKLKRNDCIYYHIDFKYEKLQKLSWKLDANTLNKLKNSNIGKRTTSKIYNNMFALQIYPNGNNKSGAGKCIIALVLCALSTNRSKIRIQWNLMVNELNFRQNKQNEFTLTKYGSTVRVGTFEEFTKCIAFTITANILIIKEYDYNEKEIHVRFPTNSLRQTRSVEEEKHDIYGAAHNNTVNTQYIDDKLAVYDTKLNALSMRIEELMEDNKLKDEKIKVLEDKLVENIKSMNDNLMQLFEEEKKMDNNKDVMDEINKLKIEINRLKNGPNDDDELQMFLETECNLAEYIEVFKQNGFDDMESLYDINMNDLKELGIKMGHRKKIIKYIEKRNIAQNINIKPSMLLLTQSSVEGCKQSPFI